MDAALFTAINSAHVPVLDVVMAVASRAGYGASVWFALAVAAMFTPRHRAAAARVCLALALTLFVNDRVVKPAVSRVRPSQVVAMGARVVELPAPVTPSFPSGHAASATAAALALARVWPSARLALAALATLIAFSRIYVGVHYPSDVVAGALLGATCAFIVLAGCHPSTWSRPPAPGERHVP